MQIKKIRAMAKLLDRDVRAKLSISGVESLSDAELISILIGEGSDTLSALELAQNVIDSMDGNLSQLAESNMVRMRMTSGLGVKRAAMLCTAFELGRRSIDKESHKITSIVCNEDVLAIFSPMLESLAHEELWVLYLSSANTILHKMKISQGGVSGTVVDSKLIVKRAVELLAVSIIVVHNHPSGVCKPSDEDIVMTDKLVRGMSLFDIRLLDHLIISKSESFSFRHHGLLV